MSRILLRRGNKADLPALLPGEPGFATDTKELYVGATGGNEQIYAPYDKTSGIRAYQDVSQSLASGAYTKILFQAKEFDNLTEFDTTNSRFTSKGAGNYFLTAAITVLSAASGTDIALALFKNGATFKIMQENRLGSAGNLTLTGSGLVKLSQNDYIEIYAVLTNALSTQTGALYTYLEVAKK